MWRLIITVLLLAVFCLGAAVSYFNWASVTFNYLAGQTEMPLIALLLGMLFLYLEIRAYGGFGVVGGAAAARSVPVEAAAAFAPSFA